MSVLAVVTSVGLSRLAEQSRTSAQDANVQALATRVGEFEQQAEAIKRQPTPITQTDFDTARQALEERLSHIEEAQSADARASDVQVSLMSGATDSSDPHGNTAFTSNTQDRISSNSVPLIEPAHVVALPKGQCFALTEGGNLWKVRMPLPAPDPDEAMPKDLQELAGYMRQHYVEAGDWWENQGIPGLQDKALPDDLLDDFKQMAAAEEAEA